MNLIDEVDDLCRKINKRVNRINSGGCAVFAALMGQCLEQYGRVGIAVGTDERKTASIDKARKNIEENVVDEWNDNDVWFAHIVIEFEYQGNKYHVDSTGVHDVSMLTHCGEYTILKGRLTVHEVTELASQTHGWNYAFERSQIPTIKQLIDSGFKKMFERGLVPTIS